MSELAASILRVNGYWNKKTLRQKWTRIVVLQRGHLVLNILLYAMAANVWVTSIFPLSYHNSMLRKDALEVEEDKTCLMFTVLPVRKFSDSDMWDCCPFNSHPFSFSLAQ